MKRLAALVASFVLLAAPAFAQGQVEKPKLSIATASLGLTYLPLILADRLGYFKDEGLAVEIVPFQGGSKALEALLGGSTDVVSGAYSNTLTMAAKGQKLVAFVAQVDCPGWVLGVSKSYATKYKSLRDLEGAKIGVSAPGSSTHMAMNYILTTAGVKPDAVSIIGVGTSAAAVASMQRGNIDAIINNDPVVSLLLEKGDMINAAEMRSRAESAKVFGGPYPEASLYSTAEFVRRNPKTVQAVTNAIVRAERWIEKATVEQLAEAVPPEYLLGDRGLYMRAFQNSRGCLSTTGLLPKDGMAKVLEVLSAFDPTIKGANINIDDTYDNGFVERAGGKAPPK
jgi:NitT/TauT family transport system substrate-binding protein